MAEVFFSSFFSASADWVNECWESCEEYRMSSAQGQSKRKERNRKERM